MSYIGIPPLLIAAKINQAGLPVMTADAIQVPPPSKAVSQWGIFKDGTAVVTPDNVVSFDFKKDWRVSNYPQEEGAFQSYNKVTMPYDARVTMSKGGTNSDRQDFLNEVEFVAASFDLYDIVTPERIYVSANIAHIDYRRTAVNGVGLLSVDIWLTEIRVTITPEFSNTASVNSVDPVRVGTVQPQSLKTQYAAPLKAALRAALPNIDKSTAFVHP